MFPAEEYQSRLSRLRSAMEESRVDGVIIADRANSLYYSGFPCSNSFVLVSSDKAQFMTDSRYIESAGALIRSLAVTQMSQDGILNLGAEIRCLKLRKLGFDGNIPYQQYSRIAKAIGKSQLFESSEMFSRVRSVKSPAEIDIIAKNQSLTGKLFSALVTRIRLGQSEAYIRRMLRLEMLERGVEEAFDTIIAAGANSSRPHAVPGKNKVKSGQLLLFDMGVKRDFYHSDMTRTVATGELPRELTDVYRVVKEAQQLALEAVAPGVACSDVDAAARNHIRKAGYGDYFGHGTGHGVGLEIHEHPALNPVSKEVLREGMIITVEPGIYLPRKGGVRIEDSVVVTSTGFRNLTSIPKTLRKVLL